jgi:hypothetical protein
VYLPTQSRVASPPPVLLHLHAEARLFVPFYVLDISVTCSFVVVLVIVSVISFRLFLVS